jgi:hypothetical protein
MKIVLLGLTSGDAGETLRDMQVMFGDALQLALSHASIASRIETIFVTPIVVGPGIGPFPDKLSYLRSAPAINLSINVPYDDWVNGSIREHIDLIAAVVTEGINRIKDSKIDSHAKQAILECVEETRRHLLERETADGSKH